MHSAAACRQLLPSKSTSISMMMMMVMVKDIQVKRFKAINNPPRAQKVLSSTSKHAAAAEASFM